MKKIRSILFFLIVFCILLLTTWGFTKETTNHPNFATKSNAAQLSQNMTNRTLVNVGRSAMWIHSNGLSARNSDGKSGLFFPRDSNPSTATIFQDGLIWGGKVQDGAEPEIRVGGAQYAVGHVAGAIISPGIAEDKTDPAIDRVWRIRRDFSTADLTLDAAEFNSIQSSEVTPGQIQQIRDIYRQDWLDWPAEKGAPFYDADKDGLYNPDFNSDGSPKLAPVDSTEFDPTIHADEPGYANADQVVWLVTNDLDEEVTRSFAGAPPIGLEQQITLWAYNRSDALGHVIFKQFRLIYKGAFATPSTATIEDMYFGQWSDPDLGRAGDDLAGCDVELSLGFVYNNSSADAIYASAGLPPPAFGYDFFAGPLVSSYYPSDEAILDLQRKPGFRNLPMTTFLVFGSEPGDPGPAGYYDVTLQWFNVMRGFYPRPITPLVPFQDPTGQPTKFVVPGDPVKGTGWVDTGSGDRRIFLATGPFSLAFDDTQETVIASISALGTDRLSSISVLKFFDRVAQEAFNNLFEIPQPPPAPALSASEFDGEIFLNWAGNADAIAETEGFDENEFFFEGYNVYQLPTAKASIEQSSRIATFDIMDDFTTIVQESFDANLGIVLQLPRQFGSNTGIQRTFKISIDAIRGLDLVNGQTYYFGLSAYSVTGNGNAVIKTQESPMAVVTVVPQSTKPGVRFQSTAGDTIPTEHSGGSDGIVKVLVTDPSALTGDSYEVSFDVDTTGVLSWSLTNITTGDILLPNQANQSGDANYLVTEGFTAIIIGAFNNWTNFLVVANGAGPVDPATGGAADFQGFPVPSRPGADQQVGAGVWLFNAGGGSNQGSFANFIARCGRNDNFSRIIPFDYEMRFTAGGSMGHWWAESGNMGAVPFELWNIGINTPDDPRDDYRMCPRVLNDLNFGDTETIWDIGANGGAGGENSDHPTADGNDDPYTDWVYWLNPEDTSPGTSGYDEFVASAGSTVGGEVFARTILVNWNGGDVTDPTFPENLSQQFPEEGTIFRIITTKPNTPSDIFTFSTSGYEPTESIPLARQDVADLVNVFPNPHYGINDFGNSPFDRKITFSHLPEKATIRIFNLAGILVRKLEKNDPSQFLTWNLQTENSKQLANGIYIANIEMPDLGVSKNLKIALSFLTR